MHCKHYLVAVAAGIFLTTGISAEAVADSKNRTPDYRGHHVAGHAGHSVQVRKRRVAHHRSFKRPRHYTHGYYRSPQRHRLRVHHAPRSYRAYRYARHHRYNRYHREINAGAVFAGLILGGVVYEILKDDYHEDDAYYEDH